MYFSVMSVGLILFNLLGIGPDRIDQETKIQDQHAGKRMSVAACNESQHLIQLPPSRDMIDVMDRQIKEWKSDKRDQAVPNKSSEAPYNVKSLACSNWQANYFGGW